MKRLQAYQYELKPNGAQRRDMRRFAGACRFVFNRALAWQKDRYAADSTTKFSYTVLANFLPAWKKDKGTEWLKLDQENSRIFLPKLGWVRYRNSQTCPKCEHHHKANRPTQAAFACVQCRFEEHADVVGAINVLRAGHAQFACEVSGAVRPPAAGTHRSDSGGGSMPP